ncbi:Crp/Fnr family transcriptional regulator [Planktothrix paucivesiculata]|uniref:Transcriptional Regulator, Crp/Fnr family n=1 Tax=Planktothrix paucivesiculata PCC 9631 TaxID=671071 RepID=A0A7Z9BS54_9CYAN|nr:Crp/Fnr family transcriptional regulator [Planktothrix paucivesiculata]VXD21749.1 putative Transcriptional Regulator, Crp/Fnr family [Planktothrix paucivesiculata PCC 9631]
MTLAQRIAPEFSQQQRYFQRRDQLPARRDHLWKIESGVVRTFTYLENGTVVTLGLWGVGDVVSRVLSKSDPYYMECVTPVQATSVAIGEFDDLNPLLIQHIHQLQTFLEIVHSRPVDEALHKLFLLLANKFGSDVPHGQLIEFHLTHQEIAESIGTTRVTVTRLLKEFEQQGIIERLNRQFIILPGHQPFWHYEI